MLNSSSRTASNGLIDGLPDPQRIGFLAGCRTTQLRFGQPVGRAGDSIEAVHFPLTAIVSRVAPISDRQPLAVGLVGNEGMLGEALWLGSDHHPIRLLVQASGTALEMSAERFRDQLMRAPALGPIVARYLLVVISQLAQNAACHAFHALRERLARWLLMTHDRVAGDQLDLTHQFLSDMLGVRRSAVSIAASDLQSLGLISYTRGRIRILSRPGLEAIACECYAASLQAYERQLSDLTPTCGHSAPRQQAHKL